MISAVPPEGATGVSGAGQPGHPDCPVLLRDPGGCSPWGHGMKSQGCMQCNTHCLFQMRTLKAREEGACRVTLGVRDRAAAQLAPLLMKCSRARPVMKACSATHLGGLYSSQHFLLCLCGCSQERLGEQSFAPLIKNCVPR